MKRGCLAVFALALAGASCLPAAAQALRDPTRPPAPLIPGGAGARAAAPVSSGPRLQSVLIARQPGGRHVAVIDGETVRLGGSFRGARVARMTENQVELVRGRERQVLRLDPADSTAAGITPAAQ